MTSGLLALVLLSGPSPASAGYASLAASLTRISEAYYYEARLAEGVRLLTQGLALLDAPEASRVDVARVKLQRGRLLHYQDSLAGHGHAASLAALRDARAAAEGSGDRRVLADAEDALGLSLYSQAFEGGDFDTPRTHFEKASAVRKELKDELGLARSSFHLALVHENRNCATAEDKKKARALYAESLRIAERRGFKLEESYATRHLAGLRQESGDLVGALKYFERSLALREEIGFKVYLAPAILAVGDVHAEKKDFASALPVYRRALAAAEAVSGTRFVVASHVALGKTRLAMGEREAAREHFQTALERARAAGFATGVKEATELLAGLETD